MRKNEYEVAVWRHPIGRDLRWVDARSVGTNDPDSRWMVSVASPIETQIQSPWPDESPSKPDDLFQTFCSLNEDNETAIIGFAKTHGLLGIDRQVEIRGSRTPSTPGESHGEWIEEIRFMRDAHALASALAGGRLHDLKEWIDIDVVKTRPHARIVFKGKAGSRFEISAGVRSSGWSRAAKFVLASMINHALKGSTEVRAVVRGQRIERQLMLWSLRAEMWTQLLDSYTDDRIYFCEGCGKRNIRPRHVPGERKPNKNRTLCFDPKTKTTVNACKMQARRDREREEIGRNG